MPREGWATVIALASAFALATVGSPAEHAVVWSATMVGWGVAVAALLRPAGHGGRARWAGLAAAAVRLPFFFVPPTLSDDVYRYVWEGEVWHAGRSPFAFAPDSPMLEPLRDGIWAHVNHREISSIYPPAAQLLFWLLSPGGVLGFRVFMAACDVATAMVLARRSVRAGFLWALLPLCVVEGAVSGHLESAGMLLVALSLASAGRAADGWAWLATMVKLLPGVLLVRTAPRVWVAAAVATLAAVGAIAGPGLTRGFEAYRQHWAYNGSIYPLLVFLVGNEPAVRAALQIAGVCLVGWALFRFSDRRRIALWTFGTFAMLSPTVHPWYGLWPLLPSLFCGAEAWTLLAALLPGAYVVLATYDPGTSTWSEPAWVRPAIYLPFYAILLSGAWRAFRFPSPQPA